MQIKSRILILSTMLILVLCLGQIASAQETEEGTLPQVNIIQEIETISDSILNLVDNNITTTVGAAGAETRIAVIGVKYDGEFCVLGDLISRLVSTELANQFPSVDLLTRQDIDVLEDEIEYGEGGELALLGADYVIIGSAYKLADTVILNVQLITVLDGNILGGINSMLPSSQQLTALLRGVAERRMEGWDRFEPDNDAQHATELTFGSSIMGHTLRPANDTDWYTFEITDISNDVPFLMLTIYTEGSTDTMIDLCGPYSPEFLILQDDDSGSDLNAMIDTIITENGQYWLHIMPYADSVGAYTLVAYLEAGEVDEYEPDNTAENATELLTDGEAQFHNILPPNDEDWFVISIPNVSESGNDLLTIETTGNTDTFLYLYGPDSPDIYITEDDDGGMNMNAKIEHIVQEAGNYYVKVRHYSASTGTGDYSIYANLDSVEVDDFEPDNEAENAGEIPTDGTAQTHSFMPGTDIDWVTFTLDSDASVQIETSGEQDTVMTLYGPNSSTEVIMEDDDSGEGYNSLINENLDAGTYYVRIRPYSASYTGDYTITVTADEEEEIIPEPEIFEEDIPDLNGEGGIQRR